MGDSLGIQSFPVVQEEKKGMPKKISFTPLGFGLNP